MTTTLKWGKILTRYNCYGKEVIDKFSEDNIYIEVGVHGLSEEDAIQFLLDLEKIINKELSEEYGELGFNFCSEYGVEREHTLIDEMVFGRRKGHIEEQKKEIMESFKKACKELKKQYQ